jgi:hypothetical protein
MLRMKRGLLSATVLAACLALPTRAEEPRTVRVFVALCDNAHQGIAPVPAHLGRGDDPASNLYWGASGGVRHAFSRSAAWERISTVDGPRPGVLQRAVFRHRASGAELTADAYDGRRMEQALTEFLTAASGRPVEGPEADLAVFLGHNGLMDGPVAAPRGARGKDYIALCCLSERYFPPLLAPSGAKPVLLTRQLMYPGAMVLESAVEGWLRGETPAQIGDRAGRAYAGNQKISFKAARGVFWRPSGGTP